MIKTATYRMLVKRSDVKIFAVIILKIDRLITTVENKPEEVNLHELFHAEALEQVKIKLLSEYHDYLNIFDRAMINQLSLHHFYNHKIELINEEILSRSRLYQMFNHKLQKIKKYLINHLNKEFIFFSFTSYVSLILFVEKKDDSLRFCINYRKLNALIKRDHYFLSLIDETFAHIQESKYLTRLNIIVAFNKLRMHSDSKDLTIFIIFFNLYKYHVMLFELINESTFYQHYMNDMLFKYLHQFCQIYLDDIIIYSKILKKHKQHVWLILNRLREADLQIDINKCKFHVQKTIFLELLISIEELKMNSRKIQAVVDWSTFNNLTQMQFFIDFCNFYRRFIKNFSKIVHSMIQLTQKKIIFEWNEVCQIVFDHMKRCMIETFILRHFDQTREIILEIDSFNYVNDEVLSQYDDEKVLHSIVFYSKNMSFAECNYEIYDKELLVIIQAFEHWRFELKLTDISIKMFIDHQTLISLMKDKELSRRQMRWVQKLADFNFRIMYQSDKQNIKIDALTHQADVVLRDSEDERIWYQWITILTSNQIVHCETSHDLCVNADADESFLMSNIENELHWISFFKLFFMSVWFVSVWVSVTLLSQCADAQSTIEITHVHHQSSCLLLHFQALLHILSLNVTSAWLFKIKCSHVQSKLITDMFDLLLISWFSLFLKRFDYHCIFCISFHDTLDSLLLRLQNVSLLRLILSAHHDEWWLKSIFSIFYLTLSSFSSWLL